MLTFLIYKIHCTQIYYINLAHEQIYGKPKRNVFIVVIKMAFRFVLYKEIHCMQIYCINLTLEQIHEKTKRNGFIYIF